MNKLIKLVFFITIIIGSQVVYAKNNTLVIGIAGGSGSGKTTMAKILGDHFSGKVIVINQDDYYKDLSHIPLENRFKQNFDHPDAIDFKALQKDILDLKAGKEISQPGYNFVTCCKEGDATVLKPADIIIVEGILIFAVEELRSLFDFKVFIDTQADIRAFRRIKREIYDFNRDFNQVYDKYLSMVNPMYIKYVEPSKYHADLIVPNGGKNAMVLSLLKSRISEFLTIKV